MSLHDWLRLKPFDESEESKHSTLHQNPLYLLLNIINWVLMGGLVFSIIRDIHSNSVMVFFGLYLATRTIEILVEWHTDYKNTAKNTLFFVVFFTICYLILKWTY
ncbi:hypothetical protein R4575_18375 [Acinetobacter baumannii]|nr:hypothetical protein [Acinetobacter baumannii]